MPNLSIFCTQYCEILVSKFLDSIFGLENFRGSLQPSKINTQNICYKQIFVRLIMVVHLPHENISTTKIYEIMANKGLPNNALGYIWKVMKGVI